MVHEFDGKKYKKASIHQKEWGNKIISEFSLIGSEKILDLGCGDGALTKKLAQLVPDGKVTGIDASEGMIKEAKKLQINNLEFIHADINDLKSVNKYDVIFSNATLHWIKNHKLLLKTIITILNNKGIVRLNFASDGNCSHFFSVVKEEIKHDNYREHFKDFIWPWFMPTIEEYQQLVNSLSTNDIEIWEENLDRHFPDTEAITRWVDQPSIVPFLSFIDDKELKIEFRNSVVSKVIEKTIQPNGSCFETFRRINVKFINHE